MRRHIDRQTVVSLVGGEKGGGAMSRWPWAWTSGGVARLRWTVVLIGLGMVAALVFASAASALIPPRMYWASIGAGSVGEANLDGTAADSGFVGGVNYPYGVAVDGSHI